MIAKLKSIKNTTNIQKFVDMSPALDEPTQKAFDEFLHLDKPLPDEPIHIRALMLLPSLAQIVEMAVGVVKATNAPFDRMTNILANAYSAGFQRIHALYPVEFKLLIEFIAQPTRFTEEFMHKGDEIKTSISLLTFGMQYVCAPYTAIDFYILFIAEGHNIPVADKPEKMLRHIKIWRETMINLLSPP